MRRCNRVIERDLNKFIETMHADSDVILSF